MKLRAYELADGGAVLVDLDTGLPAQVPHGRFLDEEDAEAFIAWLGTPCDDHRHLRQSAQLWQEARRWAPCPSCETGRCMPNQRLCGDCSCDAVFERQEARSA